MPWHVLRGYCLRADKSGNLIILGTNTGSLLGLFLLYSLPHGAWVCSQVCATLTTAASFFLLIQDGKILLRQPEVTRFSPFTRFQRKVLHGRSQTGHSELDDCTTGGIGEKDQSRTKSVPVTMSSAVWAAEVWFCLLPLELWCSFKMTNTNN